MKSLVIAKYTFLELVKSKILYNIVFLGIGLLTVTYVAYSFTYGEPDRVALDFGLGMLSLSSVGIALFIGVSLLSKEIESRTVYMIVSRPVKRSSFIVGKYLGLSGILLLNIILLASLTLSLFFLIGGEYSTLIGWTILFTIFESLIVLGLVGTLSLVTGQIMAVLYTISLYILGHAINTAMKTSFVSNRPSLSSILDAYHFFLPGFYKLNIKEYALYKNTLDWDYLLLNSAYSLIYFSALLCLSVIIFDRKNLD